MSERKVITKKSSELTTIDFDSMYDILIDNLKKIFADFQEKENDKEVWLNSIKSNDYKFILVYDEEKLVAFLEYFIKSGKCYLAEIQISDKCKGDHKTFRTLMNELYLAVNKNLKIRCYINKKNLKSQSVFTHVGMKKVDDKYYEMDYETLENYITN